MKPRLAFIDLDGTLLGHDKTASPENRRALEKLREAGCHTVIASGRHHLNTLQFMPAFGMAEWVLSSSGAAVRHVESGEWVQELTLGETEALDLLGRGRDAGLTSFVYHREGAFMEEETEWTRLYALRAGWSPRHGQFASLVASGIQKVLLAQAPEVLDGIGAEIGRAFAEQFYVVRTEPDLLEFLAPRANKATGAEALARRLGIAQDETVAFGDGDNDAEILAWTGTSVAMAHGRPSARAAARMVSPAGPAETALARAVDLVLRELP